MTPTYLTGGQIFSRLCAYRLTPFDLIKFGMVTDQCSVQVLRHRKTTFRELIQFYCQKSSVSSQRRSVNIYAVENGTLVGTLVGASGLEMRRRGSRRTEEAAPCRLRLTDRPPATSAQRLLRSTTRRHRGTSPTPTDSVGVGGNPPIPLATPHQ